MRQGSRGGRQSSVRGRGRGRNRGRGAPVCLDRAAMGRGVLCIIVLEVRLPLVLAVGSDVGLGAQQRSRCGIFGV